MVTSLQSERESVVNIRDPETTEKFRNIVTNCDGETERKRGGLSRERD